MGAVSEGNRQDPESRPRGTVMNWRRFFHRDKADTEQREELEFYLDVTAEEYVARGMEPAAARDAARKELGNTALIREEVYRMNPGFSTAAVFSLALGIGGNVAIFSVVNAVLIRPLPYPEPESLVGVFNSGVIQGETFNDLGLATGMYAGLKEYSKTFQEFGVWSSGTATVTSLGDPEQIKTVLMTQGVLPALGAHPFLGRWFSIEDDTPGTPETVILSHSYWMR